MVALNPILFEAIHHFEQEVRERELSHQLARRERNGEPPVDDKPGLGYDFGGLATRIRGWFTGQRGMAPGCGC